MKTLKQNPNQTNKGEAEVLPLSYVDAITAYKYKEAIRALKKEVAKKDDEKNQLALELAISKKATPVVEYILKYRSVENYEVLGEATVEIFSLMKHSNLYSLPEELVLPLYARALTSTQGDEKLDLLLKWGFPLDGEDEDGKTLVDLVEETIQKASYARGKQGEEQQRRHKKLLTKLKQYQAEGKLKGTYKKKGRIKMLIWLAVFVVIALICYCLGKGISESAMKDLDNQIHGNSLLNVSTELE